MAVQVAAIGAVMGTTAHAIAMLVTWRSTSANRLVVAAASGLEGRGRLLPTLLRDGAETYFFIRFHLTILLSGTLLFG